MNKSIKKETIETFNSKNTQVTYAATRTLLTACYNKGPILIRSLLNIPVSVACTITQNVCPSSITRALLAVGYNYCPAPVRALFSISVTTVRVIQQNVFPSILITEGYKAFCQNFGLSKDKVFNNILLGCMMACTASKFYVNPWFSESHENINAAWYKIDDKTISDEEYFAQYYAALSNFLMVLSIYISSSVFNNIISSMLRRAITFREQYEFVQKWLSNYAAYGVNVNNVSSNEEPDNEKTNLYQETNVECQSPSFLQSRINLIKEQYELVQKWLSNFMDYSLKVNDFYQAIDQSNEKLNLNPVKLFEDIENQGMLIALWNSRINSIVDCVIACRALFAVSPPMALSFYFGTIVLPRLLVLGIAYSLSFNTLVALFEAPAKQFLQKMNQLSDNIIRQITNIDNNAELITFLEGESFEAQKLLALLINKRKQSTIYAFLDAGKEYIVNFITNFQWLLPILASLKDVRNGTMKKEAVGPFMNYYFDLNGFLTWSKNNFDILSAIEQSVRRQSLYEERLQAWAVKRAEIEEQVTDSDKISFSGSVFADDNHENLLAKGKFTLQSGSITHIDAPSGCGKTTLFRIFRRVWGNFTGKCGLPKQKSAFLPSHVYVLGADEPLFQTVSYPVNHNDLKEHMQRVEFWMEQLNLGEHVYAGLVKLPLNDAKEKANARAFNWMTSLSDGERKRVAFCNILLKLHTQDIKFLVLDEPFKGIDFRTQEIMVGLLQEAIADSNCTVLFSNHEHNHNLNTHVLTVDKDTKQYKLEAL